MRIALCGKMGSGKSTIADLLNDEFDFVTISFGYGVKKIAKDLFNMKNKNRNLLQTLAEKIKEIDSDIWIKYALKDIDNIKNIVIDDLRFPNELEYLKKHGFTIIRINISREEQIKRLKNKYKNYDDHINGDNHCSESFIEKFNVDYEFNSDDKLYKNILKIILMK